MKLTVGVGVFLKLFDFVIVLVLRLCFGESSWLSCEESISLEWRTKRTLIFQNVLFSNRPAKGFCKTDAESHGKNGTVYTSIS